MIETFHDLVGTEGQDISLWQMCLRATLIFIVGVLAARVAATRAFGKWSAMDIIFAVVIGSNLGRAMTGSAPFVATLAATFVLVALHSLLAHAAARWSWLSTLVKGGRVRLVENGRISEAAMRQAGLGQGDLRMALRASGYTRASQVRSAFLERNGDITVIGRNQRDPEAPASRRQGQRP